MNIVFVIPFLIALYFARRTTAAGSENKLHAAVIMIGLLVSPFFFIFEIFSWFNISSGGILATTMLIFYLVLLIYISSLKKRV